VVDPNQSQTILAGSYVSGVYKTYNQGDTWYRQNAGLGNLKIQSLAYHPNNSNIVYAGTYEGGLYKSINGGTSWSASNGGVLGNHIVYDIEIDPNNPNVIYAATRIYVGEEDYNNLRGYLYKSTNAGASWSLLLTGDAFSTLDYFYDIDVNPLNSSELYLTAHSHGFYKSTDAGVSFTPINNGVNDLSARSFALDSAYPGLVYGAVWHDDAVYRTWNSGYSWANSRTGLPTNTAVFRLYVDPFGGTQKRVFACTYGNGLFSTDNFAQSWTSRGLAGQRLYDFVVANGSPQRWFAATESNGVFRTNAGSSSWSNIMGDLRLNAVTAILRDELSGGVYVGIYGKGVYAIDSSGLNWMELTEDLADKSVIDLAFYQGRMHILTESSLYYKEDDRWLPIELPAIEVENGTANLDLLSEKVGLPSEVLSVHLEQAQDSLGLTSKDLTPVLPIRLFAENDNLYVGTITNGLFMRVANNWKQVGLEGKSILDFAFDNVNGDLFAVACDTTDVCGVFKLKDDQWSVLELTLQNLTVNKLLETDNGLLAATSLGIYWIDPDNQQWILMGGQAKNILSITATQECLMAASGKGFVLQSSDCGESWQEISLEDWHYQSIGFLGDQGDLLFLGSQETGAIILPLK
jgi:photosystem II stability/assembly factor-like uncharacterized protein